VPLIKAILAFFLNLSLLKDNFFYIIISQL
jgi:hypothetical protein